jgi:hypothetical protein
MEVENMQKDPKNNGSDHLTGKWGLKRSAEMPSLRGPV